MYHVIRYYTIGKDLGLMTISEDIGKGEFYREKILDEIREDELYGVAIQLL